MQLVKDVLTHSWIPPWTFGTFESDLSGWFLAIYIFSQPLRCGCPNLRTTAPRVILSFLRKEAAQSLRPRGSPLMYNIHLKRASVNSLPSPCNMSCFFCPHSAIKALYLELYVDKMRFRENKWLLWAQHILWAEFRLRSHLFDSSPELHSLP